MGLRQVVGVYRGASRDRYLFVIRPVFGSHQRSFQCPSIAHAMQPSKRLDDPYMNGEHFMGTEEQQSAVLYYSGSWVSSLYVRRRRANMLLVSVASARHGRPHRAVAG